MDYYAEKMEILISRYRVCPVCKKPLSRISATYHHQHHNTAGNREHTPHVNQSLINGMPVHPECIGNDNQFVISQDTAENYERVFSAFSNLIQSEDVDPILFFKDLHYIWKKQMEGQKK